MSENLITYLRQRREPVSAAELAAEVLKMHNVPAPAAARLIHNLLGEDERISRIGEDTYLYRTDPVEKSMEQCWLICCAQPERANHWSDWRAMACTIHQEGKSRLLCEVEFAGSLDWPAALAGFLHRIGEQDPDNALVFSGFGNQISIFRQAVIDLLGAPLLQPLLAMRPIAAALFPERRIKDAEQLAAALGLPVWSDVSIEAMSAQLAALWDHLLAALEEHGADSAEGLAALLAPEEPGLDLSRYAFDAEFLRTLPVTPGVYLMRDREGMVIYVGKAKNLAQRVKSYFAPGIEPDAKLETLRTNLYHLETIELGSELEALLLEQRLIRYFDPEVNRQMQVQARQHRRKSRYARIVILPASRLEWLRLFFLDPAKGLAHFWLQRDFEQPCQAPPCSRFWLEAGAEAGMVLRDESALAAAIADFYFHAGPAHDQAAAEIAYSWLGDQKECIHGIDMRSITSAAEAERLLGRYRLLLVDWNEKVIFT